MQRNFNLPLSLWRAIQPSDEAIDLLRAFISKYLGRYVIS